jgi:putative NADPH-quinone reductase
MLKGFFDRVLLPGVSSRLSDEGKVTPGLRHIKKLVAITSYGRSRLVALWMGDPPRKLVTRYLRHLVCPGARIRYLAHYHMNVSTAATRRRFLAPVEHAMARF